MKKHKPAAYRPLSFETLETRLPFAGDVVISTAFSNHHRNLTLTLTGDAAANDIDITQTAAGMFKITGSDGETFKQRGKPDTTGHFAVVTISGVTDIKVNLKGGTDTVIIHGLGSAVLLANNIDIKTGAVGDRVELEHGHLTGKLSINTGAGDTAEDRDFILLSSMKIDKTLKIVTGKGNDEIIAWETAAKGVTIDSGAGDDFVRIDEVVVEQALVKLGAGDDKLDIDDGGLVLRGPKKTKVNGGAGEDAIFGSANLPFSSLLFLDFPPSGIELLL